MPLSLHSSRWVRIACTMLHFGFGIGMAVAAGKPQIARVFPDFATDYPSLSPHVITGEDIDSTRTGLWVREICP